MGVVPFRVTDALREAASADPETWRRQLDLIPEQQPVFLLLADPFSPGIDALLSTLDAAFPGLPKVGGLVSGGQQPGAHLLPDEDLHRDGAVAWRCTGRDPRAAGPGRTAGRPTSGSPMAREPDPGVRR